MQHLSLIFIPTHRYLEHHVPRDTSIFGPTLRLCNQAVPIQRIVRDKVQVNRLIRIIRLPISIIRVLHFSDLCSHTRVWRLWVESVLPGHKPFYAVSTRNWLSFKRGIVNKNDIVIMGEDTPEYARGDYYLQTNGKYPYSRGERGTEYHPSRNS